jgi:hypothetical protein
MVSGGAIAPPAIPVAPILVRLFAEGVQGHLIKSAA